MPGTELKKSRLAKSQRAASLTGYGLIVGLIAILAIVAVSDVGDSVKELFGLVAVEMDGVSASGSSGGSSGSSFTGPAALASGSVTINQTTLLAACTDISITNTGAEPASDFTAITPAGDYDTAGCSETCTGATLNGGESCTVGIAGTATTAGALSGSLTVTATNGGTAIITITGAASGPTGGSTLAAIGTADSPYIYIYDVATGDKLDDPPTLLTGRVRGVAFGTDGSNHYFAAAMQNSPYVIVYNTNGNSTDTSTWTSSSPTGGDIINADTNGAYGVDFKADASGLVLTYDPGSGAGAYYTTSDSWASDWNRNSLSIGSNISVDGTFSDNGTYLAAVQSSASPYIHVRKGSTYTTAVSLSAGTPFNGNVVSFSPGSQYMAVGHASSPYVSIYDASSEPFQLQSGPAPGDRPGGTVSSLAFNPSATLLAVGEGTSSPYVRIYNVGSWTVETTLASASPAAGLAFSTDGSYLAVSSSTSPRIRYFRTSDWTQLPGPSSESTGNLYNDDLALSR